AVRGRGARARCPGAVPGRGARARGTGARRGLAPPPIRSRAPVLFRRAVSQASGGWFNPEPSAWTVVGPDPSSPTGGDGSTLNHRRGTWVAPIFRRPPPEMVQR